jgi:hypothetical protein
MQDSPVKLIGLYSVNENPDVTLVELSIDKKPNEIDIGEFTQEIENEPRLNWQAPFAEKYLDKEGETIIGDDMELPDLPTDTTRLTFFFYFLDTTKPLMTPFGQLDLMQKREPPKRIKDLIAFEDPE